MKSFGEIINNVRVLIKQLGEDGGCGYLYLPRTKKPIQVVFSNSGGWDHVSVSLHNRCCTWDEMCQVKDIFFHEDECVLQYHPTKKDYINIHPYVLHLWRPQDTEIVMPPKEFV